MRHIKKTGFLLPALLFGAAAGCNDALTVEPRSEVPTQAAIVDAGSARAAQAGLYDALQDGSYYGEAFVSFGDLPSDDVIHTGTFTNYADADANRINADNGDIAGIWEAIYQSIDRANQLIAKIPGVPGMDDKEKNQIVGEAYLVRALGYHNLVKFWGGVPIVVTPAASVEQASQIARSSVAEVYAQILSDLTKAEQSMTTAKQIRKGSLGAVRALRARVMLYQQNWAGAEAAANSVIAMGYSLAPNFPDLFTPEGQDTPEDIWRVSFTAQEFNSIGFYYQSKSFGGRREEAPSSGLNSAFEAGDLRKAWSIRVDPRGRRYGNKYPTAVGAEDLHVIRFAEVLLIKAEAQARQNKLAAAIDTVNLIRRRAGLQPLVLGVTVISTGNVLDTQQEVIDAILKERRLELAMEGDRFPDLVRTGRAVTVLGIQDRAYQQIFPIPQRELDVAPKLTQNPGY